MKIAYLIREDFSQIVSPCYYNLLPEFERNGNEITVINTSGNFGKHKCIKVFPKRFPDYPSGVFNKLSFSSACAKELKKKDFDIIFSSAPEYLHNLNNLKIPKIAMVQDEWSERLAFTQWFADFSPLPMKSKFRLFLDSFVQKKSIAKSNGVVFVNNSFAQKFFHKNKTVIPNGVDFSLMKNNLNEIKKLKKEFNNQVVLFLGRLEMQKNPLLFARIAQSLEVKTDAKFLIAGEGEERKNLEKFIEKNNLKNIELLGWIDSMQKNKLFGASDIYVLPSLFDPFPVSLVEAMFAQNAVIASNVGGIKDAIQHNQTGLLCENNNFDAFRNSVKLLLNHPSEAKNLARNAKKSAEKNYSIKTIAEQYIEFFEGAMK